MKNKSRTTVLAVLLGLFVFGTGISTQAAYPVLYPSYYPPGYYPGGYYPGGYYPGSYYPPYYPQGPGYEDCYPNGPGYYPPRYYPPYYPQGPGYEDWHPQGPGYDVPGMNPLPQGPGYPNTEPVYPEQVLPADQEYYIFGEAVTNGTWERQSNGSWKLRRADGRYASSEWAYLDQNWYLIDYDGTMLTGFRKVNGTYRYFNSVGAMKTGWLLKYGRYYYMNQDGSMCYGWVNDGGYWYYFDRSSGEMLTNARTPDGYYVNSEGKLIG